METNSAIIAMAKEIAAQQAEIEKLRRELESNRPSKPAKKSIKQEQHERVTRWMEKEYARSYQAATKKFESRIKEVQKLKPGWMPQNDALEATLFPERFTDK